MLDFVRFKCYVVDNMGVVSTTVLRNNLADAINEVSKKRDYLLVAKRGKVDSALVNIELFEDLLALANKKYLKSIKKAREEYQKGEMFTHEQVFGEI
ncbi:hypothetical protein ACFLZP_01105 [Patescibacteria group bacterium]